MFDHGDNVFVRNTASDNGQNLAQAASGKAMGAVQSIGAGFSDPKAWANCSC